VAKKKGFVFTVLPLLPAAPLSTSSDSQQLMGLLSYGGLSKFLADKGVQAGAWKAESRCKYLCCQFWHAAKLLSCEFKFVWHL